MDFIVFSSILLTVHIFQTIPEYPAEDLHKYMNVKNLEDLNLTEPYKIGYTYKCLGAGFWAFRQKDFRTAIEALTREVSIHFRKNG